MYFLFKKCISRKFFGEDVAFQVVFMVQQAQKCKSQQYNIFNKFPADEELTRHAIPHFKLP